MQKILILTESTEADFEATHISSDDVQYIVFNDLEYAAGYLYASKKEYKPDIIMIDHDLDLIDKFVGLCTEINIDVSKFHMVTHTGETYNQINVKRQKFIYVDPITDQNLLNQLHLH